MNLHFLESLKNTYGAGVSAPQGPDRCLIRHKLQRLDLMRSLAAPKFSKNENLIYGAVALWGFRVFKPRPFPQRQLFFKEQRN
jgi:hypothetical protein